MRRQTCREDTRLAWGHPQQGEEVSRIPGLCSFPSVWLSPFCQCLLTLELGRLSPFCPAFLAVRVADFMWGRGTHAPGGHRAAGDPTAVRKECAGLWREGLSLLTLLLAFVDLKETPDTVCPLGLSLNQHLPAVMWRAPPLHVITGQTYSQRRDTRSPMWEGIP